MTSKTSKWKIILDNVLIVNLFIIIGGSILLLAGFLFSLNGYDLIYNLFQKLWFPLFIPSLSIFFTAVLVDEAIKLIIKENS